MTRKKLIIGLLNKTYELGHSQPGQWVPEQSMQYPENGWKNVHDKDRLFPKGNEWIK